MENRSTKKMRLLNLTTNEFVNISLPDYNSLWDTYFSDAYIIFYNSHHELQAFDIHSQMTWSIKSSRCSKLEARDVVFYGSIMYYLEKQSNHTDVLVEYNMADRTSRVLGRHSFGGSGLSSSLYIDKEHLYIFSVENESEYSIHSSLKIYKGAININPVSITEIASSTLGCTNHLLFAQCGKMVYSDKYNCIYMFDFETEKHTVLEEYCEYDISMFGAVLGPYVYYTKDEVVNCINVATMERRVIS